MREIIIGENDSNQRLDRFLKKYLDKASTGFINKMIRKRNIKLNDSRAKAENTIVEGDIIQLYLADETIDKFRTGIKIIKSKLIPNIVYEDSNIILINKEVGSLSHGAGGDFEENVVDSMISYLIEKGDYLPRIEKTFTPSICNRLDRNTSGLIIGAKNYESLRLVNEALKNREIKRYYRAIVKGSLDKDIQAEAYLLKDGERNLVSVSQEEKDDSKKISTKIRVLDRSKDYSLLEVELITGRSHQIRSHLSSLGYPIIGDRKYGDPTINKYFKDKYDLENQWLHAYKLGFNGLTETLDYLNGEFFEAKANDQLRKIEKSLFKEVD